MKVIALLAGIFLYPTLLTAQEVAYRCLPCGNDCDKEVYTSAGKCRHCGMQLVLASTISFTEVSPDNICDYITQHPGAVLVDVRTKAEYEGRSEPKLGTLKGAINIPIQELPKRLSEL